VVFPFQTSPADVFGSFNDLRDDANFLYRAIMTFLAFERDWDKPDSTIIEI
jgi:hypothetical protein